MSIDQNTDTNNEHNLKDFLLTIWRGKVLIILFSCASVLLASLFLQHAERKYFVEYKLKPVSENENSLPTANLGGIASFAGIQLPSNTNNDFKIFKELITSLETSEIIFKNKSIVKQVFISEWNESINDFSKPSQTRIQSLVRDLKTILTGNDNIRYYPPDRKRLATFIANNIQILEDKDTGFLKITSESSNPNLMEMLIVGAADASDKIMRQRYIEFSSEPLAFYKEKLRSARSREHREALASLISTEEQKLMFASKGKYFVAEPYLNPRISLYPSTPQPSLVLTLSLILGLFSSAVVIVISNAIKKEN